MSTGGKWKYNTLEELEAAIQDFFDSRKPVQLLDSNGQPVMEKGQPVWERKPPTITGLALHLGFKDRESLYEQARRGDDFAFLLSCARSKIEEFHECRLGTGDRCSGSQFFLGNHGWKSELQLSGAIGVASFALSPEEESAYKENFKRFFGGTESK